MKEFLLNLENKDKIGIYRFDIDGFSVGNIIKIWDNYLLLKSYDTQNDEDGMKIYQIDKIQRIILDSNYIKKMQYFGVSSLLMCAISMLFLFFQIDFVGKISFAISLVSLIISLLFSLLEIQISLEALRIHLNYNSENEKNQE